MKGNQSQHSNTTGAELLFGPFIEQLIPLLKRIPEMIRLLKKWICSQAKSPLLLFSLFSLFILGIWGGYIFFMKCSPVWFVNMFPESFVQMDSGDNSVRVDYAFLGDSYGFINTLFAGFAIIGVVLTFWQQNKVTKMQAKSIDQQGESIQLQQKSIIAQIKAAEEQVKVNNAQMKAMWMQDAMMLISHLSEEVQRLSISYTCEDGTTIHTKRGRDVIKLIFELSCQICAFRFASLLARERGLNSSSWDFYFWDAKNTFNDCIFELKHFMTIRKYVINRIFSYPELSTSEKEQLILTLPLESTKEIILLRALKFSSSVDSSSNHNELSILGFTDGELMEEACFVLVKSTSSYIREITSNVFKKQRKFAKYSPTESEQIIMDIVPELKNPDSNKELQKIAMLLITDGMEMT